MDRSNQEKANEDGGSQRSNVRDTISGDEESAALLERARQNDTAALGRLTALYDQRLRRIVRAKLGRSRLRRTHESGDFVQEAMLKMRSALNRPELTTSASIVRWLARIAEHKTIDGYRHMTADKRDMRRVEELPTEGLAAAMTDVSAPGPLDQALTSEQTELIRAVLNELSPKQLKAVVAVYYSGETPAELAQAEGCEEGAIHGRLHRALVCIGKALRHRGLTSGES